MAASPPPPPTFPYHASPPQFLPLPPSTSQLHALPTGTTVFATACSATYRLELALPRVSPTKGTRLSSSFLPQSFSQTENSQLWNTPGSTLLATARGHASSCLRGINVSCLCSPDNLITCCTCSPQDQDQRNLIYCLSLSTNNPSCPRIRGLCCPGRAPSCRYERWAVSSASRNQASHSYL